MKIIRKITDITKSFLNKLKLKLFEVEVDYINGPE